MATVLGACTGRNLATGVGSAAMKDTFVNAAVAGNFRCAACFAMEKDCEARDIGENGEGLSL